MKALIEGVKMCCCALEVKKKDKAYEIPRSFLQLSGRNDNRKRKCLQLLNDDKNEQTRLHRLLYMLIIQRLV